MPLSEFLKLHNLEFGEPKTTPSSADLSSFPENEVVELIWENGQILMQGHSSRAKRSPTCNNLSSQMPMIRDKHKETSSSQRIGKFCLMDSALDEVALSVPSSEMDLSQDDEIVPWLNYSLNNSVQQDYSSELVPEASGVMANELPARNNFTFMNKTGGSSVNSAQRNASKVDSSGFGLFSSWSSQKAHHPPVGSGVSDIIISSASNNLDSILRDSVPCQASVGMKMQKQETSIPGSGPNLLNFSHFSKPAALVRANVENIGGSSTLGSAGMEMKSKENKEKQITANCLSPVNATAAPSETCSTSKNEIDHCNQPDIQYTSKTHNETIPLKEPNTCLTEGLKNDHNLDGQFVDRVVPKEVLGGDKSVEPGGVACSSVCSGSSPETTSNDQSNSLKRKYCDNEESGCQSEDIEEESVGLKRAASARGGTGSKRSRAAEVHNLSERRRRDRINEKMRALQELIPNCNKTDKASMLDEAIEYLKTLQLQVQIMSMGAGFSVPPMMYPVGMHAAWMPQFPLMGLGMGFSTGIQNMNAGSIGCPLFPIPPMLRVPLSSPPFSGPSTFPGMGASDFPVFGHPGLCHPISIPKEPATPSGPPATSSAVGLSTSRMGIRVEDLCTSTALNPEDNVKTKSSQLMNDTDPSRALNHHSSSQIQATTNDRGQPALVLKGDQLLNDTAINLISSTDVPGNEAGSD